MGGMTQVGMWKPLPLVTVVLAGVSVAFAVLIEKELTTGPRQPARRSQPAASVAAAPAAEPARPAPTDYAIIAGRNLFSPTRSEAPVTPPTPPPAVVLPKPNLFGVILRDGAPVAYLEDPVTKRVGGYRVGDSIAGGTVKTIESESVMLSRPDGQVAVRLHDPTRPRPAASPTPTPAPTPGAPTLGVPTRGTPAAFPPQGFVPGPREMRLADSPKPFPPGVLERIAPRR